MYVCDRMVITKVFSCIVPQSTRHLAIPREREHVRPYKALSIHTLPPLHFIMVGVGYTNSKVRVTSFDGSKYLADTLTYFISDVLPQPVIPVTGDLTLMIYMYSYVCIHVRI